MTATPKETKYVSNIQYFGEPLYIYSLKQGIEDGFLAPYKVIRITMDRDAGWRPEAGKVDKYGHEVPDQIYNIKDYDRNLVLEERTERVAEKGTEFLKKTDRFDKTIIFCEDIDHAERMRMAIVNENSDEVGKDFDPFDLICRIAFDQPPLTRRERANNVKKKTAPLTPIISKLIANRWKEAL